MKFLDLFCGGGGAGLGLHQAGHQTLGIDNNPDAIALYRLNVGDAILSDLATLHPSDFIGFDGIFASPPCQQWSLCRDSTLPARDDAEIGAILSVWLDVIRPKVFFLENVVGYSKSTSLAAIKDTLNNLGYLYEIYNRNMSEWGVPQTRTRMILRAYRDRLIPPFPVPGGLSGWDEWLSDRIENLPTTPLSDRQHSRWQELGEPPLALVEHCGARSDCPPKIKLPGQPAWTLRASLTRNGYQYPIRAVVGGVGRKLGVREMARLCTFPDSYNFADFHCQVVGRVLGNAVPPKFAAILGATA